MTTEFDVIILGQGLAGTALAWSLSWLGARVLILDRDAQFTSSKIAAGLITPITGQRLVTTWRYRDLWPYAMSFYRRVETETGSQFFRPVPMVRLFQSDSEAAGFRQRNAGTEFDGLVSEPSPRVDPRWFRQEWSGFEMTGGGRIDVPAYLAATQRTFLSSGRFIAGEVQLPGDIVLADDTVRLPRFKLRAKRLVFCQGIEAMQNPWFRDVHFKPAKGEILTVHIPQLNETRVIHRGVWLAPLGDGLFKVGATYDWTSLDTQATPSGRDEIVRKLKEFLCLPFEVVTHTAAIRPIHLNQYPVMGLHPKCAQLGYFNGLGSKGSLHAPYFARQFAAFLVQGGKIDSDVDLQRKRNRPDTVSTASEARAFHVKRGQPPLTQQAQELVRHVVRSGETVIDATAGNGHDTQFLSELVGPEGTVFAFDVQRDALKKTSRRLEDAGLKNVVLHQNDHARMVDLIPEQDHGQVAAVMFNLGYLPGGDKSLTTNQDSTRQAIRQAVSLVRPDGVVTILAYTGHDGGAQESDTVRAELATLSNLAFTVEIVESQPGRSSGPRMFVVRKGMEQPESE
jgi:glycine oxidase